MKRTVQAATSTFRRSLRAAIPRAAASAALLGTFLALAPLAPAQDAVEAPAQEAPADQVPAQQATNSRYRLFENVGLAANIGTFGALQTEQLFEFGLEARLTPFELFDSFSLRPIVGASLLDDGGNYWYVGARAEFDLDSAGEYSLGLSFAPGIYSPGGIDLGGPVEFRSGIDLNLEIYDRLTLGAGVFHLSNGGLYSRNQGSESILFTLATEL